MPLVATSMTVACQAMSHVRPITVVCFAVQLCACLSPRPSLTPEAAKVAYLEGDQEPACEMLGEVSVGNESFALDERQPAESHDDVIVRMRRIAAKMSGNLVVIFEHKPPSGESGGYNGRARVYRCKKNVLATLDAESGSGEAESEDSYEAEE